MDTPGAAVVLEDVSMAYGDHVVLDHVSFEVPAGGMAIVLGASGSGKSTLLQLMLGLVKPDEGQISVAGTRVDNLDEPALMPIRAQLGMVFQEGGLFDSLTVRENTGYTLYERTRDPIDQIDARVREVLGYVGLGEEYHDRLPSELSGGERRRVSIARAMCAKPRIMLYDEPTSGLDPITAGTIDDQIVKLRDRDHVTSIVVTHQLRDGFYMADAQTSFLMLKDGHVAFNGPANKLRRSRDEYVQAFLKGSEVALA